MIPSHAATARCSTFKSSSSDPIVCLGESPSAGTADRVQAGTVKGTFPDVASNNAAVAGSALQRTTGSGRVTEATGDSNIKESVEQDIATGAIGK